MSACCPGEAQRSHRLRAVFVAGTTDRVIQRLARFQLIPNRLSTWRMVSMLTGRTIQP
jgi:hypothetical protein